MSVVNDDKLIRDLLCSYNNNNANMRGIGGALEYSAFEHISKKMLNKYLSPEWIQAEKDGCVYAHDKAQYIFKGINCMTHDPRRYIRAGLSTYGDNSGVVSSPPNHLSTVLELCAQAMGLASCYMAGGQAIASINCFLAPFMEGLSDEKVKQDIQGFLFELNQSFMNRGCQSIFSSINMDLEMPEWLKNETAYGKRGDEVGIYGDFEDEAKRFVHLLTEVSIEGDGNDKPLFFPNLIYNIPGANLKEWGDVFELSAKFSTPYFNNYEATGDVYATVLGCRSRMPSNWTGNPNIDCMGTGNSVYTTISLPAIALKAVHEKKSFTELLFYYMGLVRQFNNQRLEWIKKLWYTYHTADFLIQEFEGVPLYRLNDATIVLGYLVLSECLEILYGKDITKLPNKAREIIKLMRDEVARWKVEDQLRYGLFQTPAENLAYSNAKLMVDKFGLKGSFAKGTRDAPFYTNSNHVPVDSDINLIERIKLEGNNQPLGVAGNIMNVYLGESYSEPTALRSLCEKIRDNSGAYFWAFTSAFSICPECLTKVKGAVDTCSFCGADNDVFSRVTGYMTVTSSWNKGKQSELKLRHNYEVIE